MLPAIVVAAEAAPEVPYPHDLAWADDLLNAVGFRIKFIRFVDLPDAVKPALKGGGEAAGSPFTTFAYGTTIYIDSGVRLQNVCHEIGHAIAAYAEREDVADDLSGLGFNFGFTNGAKQGELDACYVELYLIDTYTGIDQGLIMQEHYGIGLVIFHDPYDYGDYDENDDGWGEESPAELAESEWYEAIANGKRIVEQVM